MGAKVGELISSELRPSPNFDLRHSPKVIIKDISNLYMAIGGMPKPP